MINIINNPIQDIVNVCSKLYPSKACSLVFVQGLKEKADAWGVTFWPDNGSAPEISVDVSAPYHACVELIAHEFAHVVAGEGRSHDEEWEKIFSKINIAFNKMQEE